MTVEETPTTALNRALDKIRLDDASRPPNETEDECEEVHVERLTLSELVEYSRWGEPMLISSLVEQGLADRLASAVDCRGNTMLHMFAANGFVECIRLFLQSCPQVHARVLNLQNSEGNTALHWACIAGQLEACKVLVEAGATVAIENKAERSPICEAHKHQRRAILSLFEEAADSGKDKTSPSTVAAETLIDN